METIIKLGSYYCTAESLNYNLAFLLDKIAQIEIHEYITTPTGVKTTVNHDTLSEVKSQLMGICLLIQKAKGYVSHENVMKAADLYSIYFL